MTTTATTPDPGLATLTNPGSTTAQTIAPWAQNYVGTYLGQGQALAQLPYQPFQGPLTAGPSSIQQGLFSGIGNLSLPSNYGQSFTNTGAPTAPNTSTPDETSLVSQSAAGQTNGFGQTPNVTGGANNSIAGQYMNPYLQASLQPQLDALTYQSQQDQQKLFGNLTNQGAFGGSRQAVAQGVGQGNLLAQQAGLIGSGYNTAYNNAQNQFNTEQTQGQNLANTIGSIGSQQQALSQADLAAQQAQYQTEQAYPYQQLQFEQGLLNGLPVTSTTSTPNALSGIGSVLAGASALNNTSVQSLLKNLGVPGF
jgi:hypothetical protein